MSQSSSIINIYNDIIGNQKVNPDFIRDELKKLGTFIDDKVSLTPLHLAVITGDLELIEQFCSFKTINAQREIGLITPLHLAIEVGDFNIMKRISIIKLLVSYGANPNIKDKYDESPLFKACSIPKRQLLVPVLIDIGAYPLENNIFSQSNLLLEDWLCKSYIDKEIKEVVKMKLSRKIEEIKNKLNLYLVI
jgi:ankyrin repeat protein